MTAPMPPSPSRPPAHRRCAVYTLCYTILSALHDAVMLVAGSPDVEEWRELGSRPTGSRIAEGGRHAS